jgi:hypothetical protein
MNAAEISHLLLKMHEGSMQSAAEEEALRLCLTEAGLERYFPQFVEKGLRVEHIPNLKIQVQQQLRSVDHFCICCPS